MKQTFNLSKISLMALSFLVLGWLFADVLPASAQTPFALDNIGQKIDADDARMVGRGGWGMAVVDSMHPGFKNIAGLASLHHIALKYTGYGEQVKSKNSEDSRESFRTLSPDVRVGIPVIKGRLAVTAGFKVGRSMQYDSMMDSSWSLGGGTAVDSISLSRQFKRAGTMLTVPLGVAIELADGISVGGTVGLSNGTIRETLFHRYYGPATIDGDQIYSSSERVQEDKFSGTNTTYSLLFSRWDWLKFGASLTPEYTLDVDRKVELGGVGTRILSTYEMTVPAEYRAGVEFKLNNRWRLGGDAQLQDFKDFKGREDWVGAMENEYTLGLGFERLRAQARHGGLGNLPLRFGVQYRQWGYWVGENPVEEKTISIGTGFPFNHDLGQLDVAFSYSKVGELAKNGLESDVFRFTLSMTGLERWW